MSVFDEMVKRDPSLVYCLVCKCFKDSCQCNRQPPSVVDPVGPILNGVVKPSQYFDFFTMDWEWKPYTHDSNIGFMQHKETGEVYEFNRNKGLWLRNETKCDDPIVVVKS